MRDQNTSYYEIRDRIALLNYLEVNKSLKLYRADV